MSDNLTARDEDGEWPQPRSEGVYVSSAGKYCCDSCEAVLSSTKEEADDFDWQRYMWECPECEELKTI